MIDDAEVPLEVRGLAGRFYAAADYDYVGLWEVAGQIKIIFPQELAEKQHRLVIEVAKTLIDLGLMAFQFERNEDDSFSRCVWANQDPERVALRVSREWAELGWVDPNPGDICWFMKAGS
jgi:hypothetical protein